MANAFRTYAKDNGGRVSLLFLLFLLAIYSFINSGFGAFAAVCCIPILVLIVLAAFHYRMLCFWALVIINYFLQWHTLKLPSGIPMSMYNEMLEIILLALVIIDAKDAKLERIANLMLLGLILWCGLCILEVLNNSCGLGINVGAWYMGTRLMAFQLLYAFLVFSFYITTPTRLVRYLYLWGALALFASFWIWKQTNIGLTHSEEAWLYGAGRITHIIQNGTLIRYFSIFSDAANFGIGIASTAVAFIIFGITSKIKKHRIVFLIIGLASAWAMFPTGTRTAIACFIVGFIAYIFLSKSVKIAVPFTIIFSIFVFIIVFTNIGQGNQQIRRMRSAFNKDDPSSNVRKMNQEAIKKYLNDAPWGLGVGIWNSGGVPANNKFHKVFSTPADSEYVGVWIRTGVVGLSVFLISNGIMILGACIIVFFRLKSRSLRGIGAGFTCAMIAQQVGAYGNMVLFQFPNCLVFYGGLTIVYILPFIEKEWIEWENKELAKIEEKKRLKLEKKLTSRV
jgi:hypothetical protein